jgi:solute carrier family 25 carnitine/acylcarnitine transporter 20/29
VCLVATGHPMDLVKVNIQTMPTPKAGEAPMYTSAIDCARKMVAKDGVRRFRESRNRQVDPPTDD